MVNKLSDIDKKKLLELDDEYGHLYKEFWFKWDRTDCKNLKTEFDKFMKARNEGKQYFPHDELLIIR